MIGVTMIAKITAALSMLGPVAGGATSGMASPQVSASGIETCSSSHGTSTNMPQTP
ncbi:hypothetical protein HRbin20_00558 [bacterium HR20]|nr:hypothetical protein HRbin20_00558 [bacterium HR20]